MNIRATTSTGPENLFPDPSLRARLYVPGDTLTTQSNFWALRSILFDIVDVFCVALLIAVKTPGWVAGPFICQVIGTVAPSVIGPDGVFITASSELLKILIFK